MIVKGGGLFFAAHPVALGLGARAPLYGISADS